MEAHRVLAGPPASAPTERTQAVPGSSFLGSSLLRWQPWTGSDHFRWNGSSRRSVVAHRGVQRRSPRQMAFVYVRQAGTEFESRTVAVNRPRKFELSLRSPHLYREEVYHLYLKSLMSCDELA